MKDYKETLFMGSTSFEMRGNLNNKEPLFQKKWEELDLYNERIRLNEGKEEIDIYTIRVYDIALSSRQVLNNYICDLTDISEKIAKYQANNVYDIYGSISMAKIKSMIPILTITGPLPPIKGEKQTVNVTYADPLNPSLDFSQENCTIDIQGTSSQYYPKKNYKIKFNEAFSFYESAIPEKEYTFKADYM
jgi:hypothetical protein